MRRLRLIERSICAPLRPVLNVRPPAHSIAANFETPHNGAFHMLPYYLLKI